MSINKSIIQIAHDARQSSISLSQSSIQSRNQVLQILSKKLRNQTQDIIKENQKDIENAKNMKMSSSIIDRLVLNENRINNISQSLEEIIELEDPIGSVIQGKKLINGLQLIKLRVPIGVIFVVFESRPNVTIDIGALCIKSGNSVILRGGKEAIFSNIILADLFREVLATNNLSQNYIQLIQDTNKEIMLELFKQTEYIDLVVPRGGKKLIQFVSDHCEIPVVKHDDGICHIYVHHSADIKMAIDIVVNSKTQRPGVCNAAETLLIDNAIELKSAYSILNALVSKNVILRGDNYTRNYFSNIKIEPLKETHYKTEYLDNEISVRVVNNLDVAIQHIQKYGSQHSDGIISKDYSSILKFQSQVTSAGIFINCSTRFHDGRQFGYGAEIGISTQKLHCRGPMGIQDLTMSKYIVSGYGQIRD